MIRKILKRIIYKEKELVKVYSHPRSGTHFLEAFIALNFYTELNLEIAPITWGHWSNRKVKREGNPYGLLFGNHYFAFRNKNSLPKIYIMRDGRAVAYSVWKTPNFVNKTTNKLSFDNFIKTPIDWQGSPSNKVDPSLTILEHWVQHVKSWKRLAKKDKNVLIVNYEELINNPFKVYLEIHNQFFKNQKQLKKDQLLLVKKPVGLLPNDAKMDSWKMVFNKENIEFYDQLVKDHLDEY